jgi:hypothetical protein
MIRNDPHTLAQRRHVLFTMLTTLGYHYPAGREPGVIAGIRQYLGGWPGMFLRRSVYVRIGEGSLAEHLNRCWRSSPSSCAGRTRSSRTLSTACTTLESKERDYMERALRYLLDRLPPDAVVRVG